MSFKTYQVGLSPTYILEDEYKRKQEEVFGEVKDLVADATNEAILAGFIDTAPDDALDAIGHNFDLDNKCANLTYDQFRVKLSQAWKFWQSSGTPARLIKEIQDLGFPNVAIVPQWIEVTPGVFKKSFPTLLDSNPYMETHPFWSNFWVVINQPHSFTGHIWGTPGAGIWGIGTTGTPYKWGSVSGDQDLLACLVSLIKKLKPAWTSCRGIVFLLPGAVTWASFNWADGTLWGLDPSKVVVHSIIEQWEE